MPNEDGSFIYADNSWRPLHSPWGDSGHWTVCGRTQMRTMQAPSLSEVTCKPCLKEIERRARAAPTDHSKGAGDG